MKINNNKTLVLIIFGTAIFFLFILPMIDAQYTKETDKLKEGLANLPDIVKIDQNLCSKQCCNFSQWPVPGDLVEKTIPEKELANYVGSNMSCNFGKNSGCVCVSKSDFNYLSNRGSNSNNSMCGN